MITILAIFIACLLCFSAVSAAENNTDNVASVENETSIVQATDEDINNISVESLSSNNNEILTASSRTFTDLAEDIENANGELNLTHNYLYTYHVSTDTDINYKQGITINKPLIINGNGFTIDGDGVARAFNVKSNNVIFNNIKFINCGQSNSQAHGGCINWNGVNGTLQNCIFDKNIATSTNYGGEVYWTGSQGKIYNCTFISSRASLMGGAVYWNAEDGILTDCNFIKCSSNKGVVYWSGDKGKLYNCNFDSCYASTSVEYSYGGAIYWCGVNGIVFDSNFTNCSASGKSARGGAIYWEANYGNLINCTFDKCYVSGSSATSSAFYWIGSYATFKNCTSKSCYATDTIVSSAGGLIYCNGHVCSFLNCNLSGKDIRIEGNKNKILNCDLCTVYKSGKYYDIINSSLNGFYNSGDNCTINNCDIGLGYFYGENCTIDNCSFHSQVYIYKQGNWNKCSFFSTVHWFPDNGTLSGFDFYKSGVYWEGNNGTLSNCKFINCHSNKSTKDDDPACGGAVYWKGNGGQLVNCSFDNCYLTLDFYDNEGKGGAVYWKGNGGQLVNCSFDNCHISAARAGDSGGSIYWDGTNGTVNNCNFTNSYTAGFKAYGGAVYWNGNYGNLYECNFQNSSVEAKPTLPSYTKDGYGSAIYWKGLNGRLYDCKYDGDLYNYLDNMVVKEEGIKLYTKLNINTYDVKPGETENITLDIGGTGNVTVYIYKVKGNSLYKKYTLPISNSQINITLDNLQFGTYNVTVISSGDEKFDSETKSVLFEALKYDSPITIIYNGGNDLIAGDDLKIDISLNTNVKGYLFLTFEGKQYVEYMYSGHATFRLPKMTGGNHKYTVNFTGDDQYNPIFVSETIDVNYKELDIDFNLNDEEEYGKAIILKPTVPSDYNNYLTVYVDDNRVNSIAPGKSVYLVPSDGLDVGEHTITIKYNGNDFYSKGECSTKINITKANMTFKITSTTDLESMQTNLKVTLSTLPASGNLTLNIDNKSYTSNSFSYGYSNFILYNLTAGQHPYTISYTGDKNINPKNESSQISIPFKQSKINITVNNISVGEVLNIDMNVVGNPLTNISLYIGETFLMNVTSDKKVNLTNLKAGTYTLTAIYNRDSVYDYSNDTKTFTVSKIDPIMTVTVNDATYGCPAKVIVGSDVDGNITVKVGSNLTFSEIKLENNVVILNVSDIDVGTYFVEVTYNGDYKYNTKVLNSTLIIKKASTNIFASIKDISFSQNTIININSSVEGIAIVKINKTIIENVNVIANTIVPVTFENISAGKHNVTITLKPTSNNYNESTFNTEFTVYKKDTSVKLNVSDSIYGENIIVNVTASEDGKIILKVSNITYERNALANTMVKINLGVLAADSYNVEVAFNAGENYKPSTQETTLIVSPAKAEITTIQVQNNTYGENTIINVKTNVTGILTVKLNNANAQTFNIAANKLTAFDLGKYDANNYNIDLYLDAGSNYTQATGNAKVTVNPKQTTVELYVDNSIYGKNVIVNVTASENGKVTVNVGTNVKTVDVEANKRASIDFGILDAKSYEVNATFDGGNNYQTSSDKTSLVVSPKASSVTLVDFVNSHTYSENVIIKVKTDADGTLTLKVGDTPQTKQVTAGNIVSFDFGILNVNSYGVTINLTAGNNYVPFQNTTSITITPKSTSIALNAKDYDTTEKVIVNVTSSENGKVTIKLGSITKTTDVVANTLTSVDFGLLGVGSYDIVANFTAGNNYIDSTATGHVKVLSKIKDDDINIEVPETISNKDNNIVIKLPADATGTVTLIIGNNSYSFTVENGVADIKVPELNDGNYDYKINYSGDSKYSSFTKDGNVNLHKLTPTTITTSAVTTVYNGNKYLVITLRDNNGNPVSDATLSVNLNGAKTVTTDSNGQAKLTTNGLAPKVYTATITFAGNTYYEKTSGSVKVTVKKATPKITAKAKTFKRTLKTKKYTITLKTNQNKVMKGTKVTIKVNKKTYTAKTNNKGVATFKITKLTKKGTFKAVITYKGNAYYNKVTKKVNIKCK